MPTNTAKKKVSSPSRTATKAVAKPAGKKRVSAKPASAKARSNFVPASGPPPRAMMAFDDDDVLPSGGSAQGFGFGRCGGRMLASQVERQICDLLSRDGVAHSHHPRHFEITLAEGSIAAYPPMIVVRGRGREGKTVVIEAMDAIDAPLLDKIRAFRKQYGLEFYLSFVASEEILDQVPFDVYDEATEVLNLAALIGRLAD